MVTLAIYLFFGLRSLSTVGLGGDEPHYLVITHSLLVDRDLQIENNHTSGDYRAFFGGDLRPDYLQRGVNAAIYSIHAPGLSALVLPGYALDGARGAIITVCVLAALAALAVFEAAAIVAGLATAWLTWAVVCFTVPFLPHAWALYPEVAAVAIVAWAIVWILQADERSATRWVWRGACLAMLPWLHTKFAVLLAGLTLCLLWRMRASWRHAAALVVPIAVSGAAWIAFFWIIYGTVDPQVPYGGYTAQFVRVENIPRSLFGLLFDQKFGFLIYAPIYLLVLPGFRALFHDRRLRLLGVMTALTAGAYVISSARLYMWWGGSSAPARFLVPVLPLLAPAVALGLTRVKGRAAIGARGDCRRSESGRRRGRRHRTRPVSLVQPASRRRPHRRTAAGECAAGHGAADLHPGRVAGARAAGIAVACRGRTGRPRRLDRRAPDGVVILDCGD